MKINTNFNIRGEQNEYSLFNRVLAPIAAQEMPSFPKGKYPFMRSRDKSKGLTTGTDKEQAKRHIDREFFAGHRYKIIAVGFVDGGSTMISLDQRGYMYLWAYEKSSFTSDVNFKPTIKLKIELNFTKFIPESSNRIFPQGRDKDINPAAKSIKPDMMQKIGFFMNDLNVPEIKEKSLTISRDEKYNTTQYFVPVGDVPEEYGIGNFQEYLFNSENL